LQHPRSKVFEIASRQIWKARVVAPTIIGLDVGNLLCYPSIGFGLFVLASYQGVYLGVKSKYNNCTRRIDMAFEIGTPVRIRHGEDVQEEGELIGSGLLDGKRTYAVQMNADSHVVILWEDMVCKAEIYREHGGVLWRVIDPTENTEGKVWVSDGNLDNFCPRFDPTAATYIGNCILVKPVNIVLPKD
jgi:hypothetical protein